MSETETESATVSESSGTETGSSSEENVDSEVDQEENKSESGKSINSCSCRWLLAESIPPLPPKLAKNGPSVQELAFSIDPFNEHPQKTYSLLLLLEYSLCSITEMRDWITRIKPTTRPYHPPEFRPVIDGLLCLTGLSGLPPSREPVDTSLFRTFSVNQTEHVLCQVSRVFDGDLPLHISKKRLEKFMELTYVSKSSFEWLTWIDFVRSRDGPRRMRIGCYVTVLHSSFCIIRVFWNILFSSSWMNISRHPSVDSVVVSFLASRNSRPSGRNKSTCINCFVSNMVYQCLCSCLNIVFFHYECGFQFSRRLRNSTCRFVWTPSTITSFKQSEDDWYDPN